MNDCKFLGRIGSDIELKKTPNGNSVVNFNLAVSEKRKQGEEWVDHTEWIPCVFWSKKADAIKTYCAKGSQIVVVGKFTTRSWNDQNGQKRYKSEIKGVEFFFAGEKKQGNQQNQQQPPMQSYSQPQQSAMPQQPQGMPIDDDLPF